MVAEHQNWEDLQQLADKNTVMWEICKLKKYVAKTRKLVLVHALILVLLLKNILKDY